MIRDPNLTNNDAVFSLDVVLDSDNDGVLDSYQAIVDNCPGVANANQGDLDKDSIGDVCDPDMDGDAVLNAADNCPVISNPNQADFEADGIGDRCDDSDADRYLDYIELAVGTYALVACGIDAWPPDFNNDTAVNI